MSSILVIVEHEGGKLKGYSKELASKAFELASGADFRVEGLALGPGATKAAEDLGAYGISEATAIEGEELSKYTGDGYAKATLDFVEELKSSGRQPQIILSSASGFGKDLLPRFSCLLKTGLATDCTDLTIESRKLKARRPIFAGKALVDVVFDSEIQMASCRPNSFSTKEVKIGAKASVKRIEKDPGALGSMTLRVRPKEVKQAEVGMKDLQEAEIIVSGGRALGSAENFKYVRELAESLGATVGASRAAVDAGYISHDHQVGQTGKTVNPKLYIACGISGAIQHLAGMRTAKVIVAINKDLEAPLFSKVDYGIVGDLFQILPILTQKFRELLGKS